MGNPPTHGGVELRAMKRPSISPASRAASREVRTSDKSQWHVLVLVRCLEATHANSGFSRFQASAFCTTCLSASISLLHFRIARKCFRRIGVRTGSRHSLHADQVVV